MFAYLLQKQSTYSGILVLLTDFKQDIGWDSFGRSFCDARVSSRVGPSDAVQVESRLGLTQHQVLPELVVLCVLVRRRFVYDVHASTLSTSNMAADWIQVIQHGGRLNAIGYRLSCSLFPEKWKLIYISYMNVFICDIFSRIFHFPNYTNSFYTFFISGTFLNH